MPYIVAFDKIIEIINESPKNKYHHVSNDKFHVIIKDELELFKDTGVFERVINFNNSPKEIVDKLANLTLVSGVELLVNYIDYCDVRNTIDSENGKTSWTRGYDKVSVTLKEGKREYNQLDDYVISRFALTRDIPKTIIDYMKLHSESLWVYESIDGTVRPSEENVKNTYYAVIATQFSNGLLSGNVFNYDFLVPEPEIIETNSGEYPPSFQYIFSNE